MLFEDTIHYWRLGRYVDLAGKLKQKLAENKVPEKAHAPPRLARLILDQGTWVEDAAIQDMWAGLLSSSCTESGDDDSNLIFATLLGSMTKLQAKILNFACEQAEKGSTKTGLICAQTFRSPLEKLYEITGETDLQRLDRELDYLHAQKLFIEGGGLDPFENYAYLTPSPLALHMYVRCQGSRQSPAEYFGFPKPQAADDATP